MDDLDRTIEEFKGKNPKLAKDFDAKYEDFKIGALLKMARCEAGLTQEQIAKKIHTNKANISRLENHTESVRLSTIQKYLSAVGKSFKISIL
jgi:DNA-binding XRE family transcriptional regulator